MNSTSRSLRYTFLRSLYCHVSIFSLEQLLIDHNRMLEFGDYVFDKCGCALQSTHGLPYACYFYLSIRSQGLLYLDDIHPFWKTLTYTEAEVDTNEGVRHANADIKEYFQSLVYEVLKVDLAVV